MKHIKIFLTTFLGVFLLPLEDTHAKEIPKNFVVSAYYSPLPNQESYVRGTYEGDLRLNGNGTHGADGTAVYPGMLAAPKTYAFGTKISIPGLGVGTVHDRGGAILAYEDFDRIDVWMGYGDPGRKRALQWGMRRVDGKIINSSVPNKMNFTVQSGQQYSVKNSSGNTVYTPNTNGSGSLWKGSKGKSVKNLQKFLSDEGFFDGIPTGFYGERTEKAVLEFQEFYNIVASKNSPGAGVFGPKTRATLENLWEENQQLSEYAVGVKLLSSDLKIGKKGYEVKRLQLMLSSLGYFDVEPNGVFGPKTQKALITFQTEKKIISSASDRGAGYFGKKSKRVLEKELLKKRKNISVPLNTDSDSISREMLALRQTKIQLQNYAAAYGHRGEHIKNLQQELIARGFLEEGFDTGYYGKKTLAAVEEYKKYVG